MSEYKSATAKKRFWTKKKAVVAGVLASFAIPAVAYAAVFIFGFGTATVAANTTAELTILTGSDYTETGFTPALVPGGQTSYRVAVRNNNAFPVTVNGLIVENTFEVTGGTAGQCDISHVSTTNATATSAGSTQTVTGKLTTLTGQNALAPGEQAYYTFPNVLKQASTATKLCGVTADFAVQGSVGS